MKKDKNNENKYQFLINFTFILGLTLTIIYIFYTSLAFKTSDSVITSVISHYQITNKQLLLTNWYYGNELFIFNLNIPMILISLIIKDNLLVGKITTFIISLLFFYVLSKYADQFLNSKKDKKRLILIFLSGISYSFLNYFYSFDLVAITVLNSMILLYLYYKCFEEMINKKLYIFTLILTFLLSLGTYKYLMLVVLPVIIMELCKKIFKNKKTKLYKNNKKLIYIIFIGIISLTTFFILTNNCNYKNENGSGSISLVATKKITKKAINLLDINFSFFGFDNKDNPLTELTSNNYFVKQNKDYSIDSFDGVFIFLKVTAFFLFMIITPIFLYKNFKKNNKKINFLLIFNTISWVILIINYFFSKGYYYTSYDLQYFIFNFVINIILGIYFVCEYTKKQIIISGIFNVFFIGYIISNIYSTSIIIIEHDSTIIDHKYELVDTLKANNLSFGYSEYWNSLLTNYLSDYKIEVVGVTIDKKIVPNKLYTDKEFSNKNYHQGKTFLIIDEKAYGNLNKYKKRYGTPEKTISTTDFLILIYENNPFLKDLG